MPINRLISRGMGAPIRPGVAGLVTSGGGGFRQVAEYVRTVVGDGAKYVEERFQEVVVRAKLITVNDSIPITRIEGFVKIAIDNLKNIRVIASNTLTTRIKNIYDSIKVTITRIK